MDHRWLDGLTWWHVQPLGFSGAEPRADGADRTYHRLRHLANWLDYAAELGVGGLQLGPIHASSTHGYDPIDHFRIDPRLGDEADFANLVAGLRDRGLRLVLDGVFNHVSRLHPRFQAALAGATDPWFDVRWVDGDPRYDVFEGHGDLVELNHASAEVEDLVVDVMCHWLGRGADGWRLDAAYAVPSSFWGSVISRVRQQFPDAWFVGEVLHDEWAYLRGSALDGVTAYGVWAALARSFNDANFHDLSWPISHMGDTNHYPPMTFVGNHDVTRLASQLRNQRHFGHALAILFTLPGVPSVYYGDEQAFRGVKEVRFGGDDAIRPMFPDRPDELAPWGWPVYRLHQHLIGLRRANPWLTRGTVRLDRVENETLMLTTVAADGSGRAMSALLNASDSTAEFDGGDPATAGLAVVAASDAMAQVAGILPPQAWQILLTT